MGILGKKISVDYNLIDTYYKTDVSYTKGERIKGGRSTKEFFDSFCQTIFKKNLIMYERSGYFPLAYSERNTYSSIGATLDSMEYTHISEWGIEIGGKKIRGIDKKFRSVDFWCTDNANEFWIEAKSIDINIKSDGECCVTSSNNDPICNAIDQIRDVRELEGNEGNKIALITMSVWCREGQEPSEKDLEKAPKLIVEQFAEYLDSRSNMGLLLGVLDCRGDVDFNIFDSGEKVPYIVIAGIVLHERK